MTEHEATRGMPAEARIVFELAQVTGIMRHWLPEGIEVTPVAPDVVEVAGEQVDTTTTHEGLYRPVPEQLRLEWGSRGHAGYAGWLQVADSTGGTSKVTVHLSFFDEAYDQRPPDAGVDVEEMLDSSLDRLASLVEQRVSQSG